MATQLFLAASSGWTRERGRFTPENCITTGWLNPLVSETGAAARVISHGCGSIRRSINTDLIMGVALSAAHHCPASRVPSFDRRFFELICWISAMLACPVLPDSDLHPLSWSVSLQESSWLLLDALDGWRQGLNVASLLNLCSAYEQLRLGRIGGVWERAYAVIYR